MTYMTVLSWREHWKHTSQLHTRHITPMNIPQMFSRYMLYIYTSWDAPHPVAVTSRIMIFIQGIPMNLSFPLLLGGRFTSQNILIQHFFISSNTVCALNNNMGFSHVPSISSATSPWRGEFPTFLAARKILVSSGRRFGSLDLRPQGKPLSVMRLGSFTTLGGPFFVL